MEIRYMGSQLAGVCHYDALRHQKKEIRVGTRAGSISIYCAREAIADSGLELRRRRQGPRRDLRRLHRARQCRDRERDLQHLEV
jgi:hypothetical protein